jgi:anti-anti-sigma factor
MNATLLEQTIRLPEFFPQATLEFEVEQHGHLVVVRVHGEATGDQADQLDEQLNRSLGPGTQFVILGLLGLALLGPAALATLSDFTRQFRRTGGEVWLAGLQPAVWLALHGARLDRLFTVRASLAQALAS